MRAVQISELTGPDAIQVVDVGEPEPNHMLTPGEGVLVDVKAAGVFPGRVANEGCTSSNRTRRSCPARR